jgi:deoxycytidylate deaminase
MQPSEQHIVKNLRNSYCLASNSRDKSNQNGATLFNMVGELIATGYNKFPMGVKYTNDRILKRPTKYDYFIHAENAAILQAARAGKVVHGSTMYCPWSACTTCAQAIIETGVAKLVLHSERMDKTPERWAKNLIVAREMFREASVLVTEFSGRIPGCPSIIVNGKLWNPDLTNDS